MKSWWAGLAPRERLILLAGSVFLLVMAFWLVIWEPLIAGRAELRQEVRTLSAERLWMEQVVDDVRRRARMSQGETSSSGSVLTLVEVSAHAAGLKEALSRVQPEGQGARLSFDQVGMDALLSWLADLEQRQGLQVTQLALDVTEAKGIVSARLLVERP
ncbi:type II secretion system protein M [Pseudomonas neustonica]|uniref:Type II secretion system protein M n=1 Tax=Pseudomonas neustonica TaxID=2487346 RepID=A0ABX9XEW7_9PSED|nr:MULTISPECIES: type II secretion system protein M [Pseudomonas]ROZ81013.1 type II secretion system protein M [Pseudomonas sp. SSM44]ROZ82311.1 type II secretion system protein M [Pseudomonas neustonica]|tara:strand:- start:2894 stop:3370 length:477 start_codon:yes stop_codon:yes gene_type:complete